ncbi:MAG: hypothetical protein ACRD5J_18820, partial [Nitrososphaeraceae archaeon]
LNNLYDAFRNLGTCESKTLKKLNDMNQLLNCFILRYKKNTAGESGPGIDGSINYLFKEKMAEVFEELESNAEFKKTYEMLNSNFLCSHFNRLIISGIASSKFILLAEAMISFYNYSYK